MGDVGTNNINERSGENITVNDNRKDLPATVETVLFDLDGTLYPNANGYPQHVRERVFHFLVDHLGLPDLQAAEASWKEWFSQYHQTARGIKAQGYNLDLAVFWPYIREGTDKYLRPDSRVTALLESLQQAGKTIWLFTNCREPEALQALKALDIEKYFEDRLVGAQALGESCKPDKEAFDVALKHIGCDPKTTVFFEDSVVNITAAQKLGMRTVLVHDGAHVVHQDRTDLKTDAIVDICTLDKVKAAAPWIWE